MNPIDQAIEEKIKNILAPAIQEIVAIVASRDLSLARLSDLADESEWSPEFFDLAWQKLREDASDNGPATFLMYLFHAAIKAKDIVPVIEVDFGVPSIEAPDEFDLNGNYKTLVLSDPEEQLGEEQEIITARAYLEFDAVGRSLLEVWLKFTSAKPTPG